MRFLIIALMSSILFSCASYNVPRHSPLKGRYLEKPVIFTTEAPFETVWSTIIDYFAIEGIPVQLIDKSSGFIVSQRMSLDNSWTIESNKFPPKSNAFVVLNEVKLSNTLAEPYDITGIWNARVSVKDGKTQVNVNLNNIVAIGEISSPINPEMTFSVRFLTKSTGKFENEIANLFTNYSAENDKYLQENSMKDTIYQNSNQELKELEEEIKNLKIQLTEQSTKTKKYAQYQSELNQQKERITSLEGQIKKLQEELDTEKNKPAKVMYVEKESNPKVAKEIPTTTKSNNIYRGDKKYLIQLASSSRSMTFNNLSDLGEIVTEAVPGRNMTRYQLGIFYNIDLVQDMLIKVKARGYKDAFVVQR